MFLAVGSLGATHEEAHLRDSREVSGRGREGKGMEAEWREEREHRLQKKNTTDAGERDGGMGSGKKNTRFGRSGPEGAAPHGDADYRQKHRRARRRTLSGSVNLRSASWSMIPR